MTSLGYLVWLVIAVANVHVLAMGRGGMSNEHSVNFNLTVVGMARALSDLYVHMILYKIQYKSCNILFYGLRVGVMFDTDDYCSLTVCQLYLTATRIGA
jgi:hypothetical protein